MAEVVLQHLAKVFGKHRDAVHAVDDLNLHIRFREILALVGPSGCGKTTTLRLIAGLEVPDHGAIFIAGREVTRTAPKNRNLAMVFQNYALYPHMSVFCNMAFGLKVRGVEKKVIEQRVADAANMLGLQHLLKRKPGQLSGGEQQRVALGRAIVRQPAAFLLDEPLSNLDASLRSETRAELKGLLRKLNTTAIYVTHDQEEAMSMGDRLAVMRAGKVVQVNRPEVVYNQPANRYVAGFVGSPKVNYLPGQLAWRDGECCFLTADGEFSLPAWLLKESRTGELVMGIRPEALRFGSAHQSDQSLKVEIKMIERLGAVQNVYGVTASGRQLVARVSAEQQVHEGQVTMMVFDDSRMMFFQADEFGKNLMHSCAKVNN